MGLGSPFNKTVEESEPCSANEYIYWYLERTDHRLSVKSYSLSVIVIVQVCTDGI